MQRNFVGKLVYSFSPKTTLQFTAYSANDWSNSTGEGDNDYETYPYVLYGAQQTLAAIEASKGGRNTILVNGKPRTCHNSIAVLVDNPPGYTCMTPAAVRASTSTARSAAASIAGARSEIKITMRARTQQLGAGTITLEGFVDAYNYNEQKGPGAPIGPYGPGPNYLYLYSNRGYLLSDDFPMSKNDFGFGYTLAASVQHQRAVSVLAGQRRHVQHVWERTRRFISRRRAISCATRGRRTTSSRRSGASGCSDRSTRRSTHFDPRVSFIFRPDPRDVIRLTGGRSYSEPDPSLLAFAPPVYGAPSSINCPPTTSGSGRARRRSPPWPTRSCSPRRREDLELAYGHRFNADDEHPGRRLSVAREPSIAQRQRLDRRLPRHHGSAGLHRQGTCSGSAPARASPDGQEPRILDDVQCGVGALPRHRALDERRDHAQRFVQRRVRRAVGRLSRHSARHPDRQHRTARRRTDRPHPAAPRDGRHLAIRTTRAASARASTRRTSGRTTPGTATRSGSPTPASRRRAAP